MQSTAADSVPSASRAVARAVAGPAARPLKTSGRVQSSGKKAPTEIVERKFPPAAQEKLAREAAAAIGFDFQAGRLDTSVHPFCSGIGPGDTRMTTRYNEGHFNDAFFGVLHETGHCLYEQGLPKANNVGLPLGESISLGIHESQSRMWENLVGRSRAYWRFQYPKAKAAARLALELDDRLAEAHLSMAYVGLVYEFAWAEAERECRRAIELQPTYAQAHHWLGWCLAYVGRLEEACDAARHALALEPLSPVIQSRASMILSYAGLPEEGIAGGLGLGFFIAAMMLMPKVSAVGVGFWRLPAPATPAPAEQ